MKPKKYEHEPQHVSTHEPTVAPGMENDELYEDATEAEVETGDFTMVTRLAWDENDNGSED